MTQFYCYGEQAAVHIYRGFIFPIAFIVLFFRAFCVVHVWKERAICMQFSYILELYRVDGIHACYKTTEECAPSAIIYKWYDVFLKKGMVNVRKEAALSVTRQTTRRDIKIYLHSWEHNKHEITIRKNKKIRPFYVVIDNMYVWCVA